MSAWVYDCPEKGITAKGYDQIAAKFTGTSVRVSAGQYNHGIFISLHNWDEEYKLTHPAAYLGGILRGSLSVTVADTCYVTCAKTKIKVILEYLEDGWLGKSQNRVVGVIFSYDPENDVPDQHIKGVSQKDIIARVEGAWKDKIYYTLGNGPFAKGDVSFFLCHNPPLFSIHVDYS